MVLDQIDFQNMKSCYTIRHYRDNLELTCGLTAVGTGATGVGERGDAAGTDFCVFCAINMYYVYIYQHGKFQLIIPDIQYTERQ